MDPSMWLKKCSSCFRAMRMHPSIAVLARFASVLFRCSMCFVSLRVGAVRFVLCRFVSVRSVVFLEVPHSACKHFPSIRNLEIFEVGNNRS